MAYSLGGEQERFLRGLKSSGKRKTVVDVYYGTSTSPVKSNIPVIEGSITYDRLASGPTTSGSIVVGDPSLFEVLEPWGTEIVIRTGISFPDKDVLVPMGRFVVDTESFKISEGNRPKIDFFDRAQSVSEIGALALESDVSAAGRHSQVVIQQMIEGAATGFPNNPKWRMNFSDLLTDDPILPGGFESNDDSSRWDMAKKVAETLGAVVRFLRDGSALCLPLETIDDDVTATDADWLIDHGVNLMDRELSFSREGAFNGVLVIGAPLKKEGSAGAGADTSKEPPPSATVYDMDPTSKTYWYGSFGRKTKTIKNEALTTVEACRRHGEVELLKLSGLTRKVTITCLPNPLMDIGDVAAVTYDDGTNDILLIDKITFNFKYEGNVIEGRTAGNG